MDTRRKKVWISGLVAAAIASLAITSAFGAQQKLKRSIAQDPASKKLPDVRLPSAVNEAIALDHPDRQSSPLDLLGRHKRINRLTLKELLRLPYTQQLEYLNLIRDTLVELDRDQQPTRLPKGRHRSASLELRLLNSFLDTLIAPACAATTTHHRRVHRVTEPASGPGRGGDHYCLNAGFMLDIGERLGDFTCEEGKKQHTFNTCSIIESLGLDPGQDCGPGHQYCSPGFGFNEDGTLPITADSTPDCNSQSTPDGMKRYRTALVDCAAKPPGTGATTKVGGNPGHEINCDGLIAIYNSQAKSALDPNNCTNSHKYCELARKKVDQFKHEVVDATPTLAEGVQKFRKTMDELAAATSPNHDCGGAGSDAGPHPASAGGEGAPAQCTQADLSDPKFTLVDLADKISPPDSDDESQQQPTCATVKLPGDRQIKLDFVTGAAEVIGKKGVAPIKLDPKQYEILQSHLRIDGGLTQGKGPDGNPTLTVMPGSPSLSDLLDKTLPVEKPTFMSFDWKPVPEDGYTKDPGKPDKELLTRHPDEERPLVHALNEHPPSAIRMVGWQTVSGKPIATGMPVPQTMLAVNATPIEGKKDKVVLYYEVQEYNGQLVTVPVFWDWNQEKADLWAKLTSGDSTEEGRRQAQQAMHDLATKISQESQAKVKSEREAEAKAIAAAVAAHGGGAQGPATSGQTPPSPGGHGPASSTTLPGSGGATTPPNLPQGAGAGSAN